jgi:ATP-dependent Clp protease ATP-binding subunit ClpA
MPKINVYLPDELAAAVKAADLPVSAICQKALAEAVEVVGAARKGVAALRNPRFDPDTRPAFAERLTTRMTDKLRRALDLGRDAASTADHVETRHLLIGILDERENLAVRLLGALNLDQDDLRDAATDIAADEPVPDAGTTATHDPSSSSLWSGLTLPARIAIGTALEASIDLGHNYLGCEHLLLGLLDDADSGAGRVLREAGLDAATLRSTITSASAGFAHARLNVPRVEAASLNQIIQRLDTIERRLSALDS